MELERLLETLLVIGQLRDLVKKLKIISLESKVDAAIQGSRMQDRVPGTFISFQHYFRIKSTYAGIVPHAVISC